MSERETSRLKHFTSTLSRQARGRSKDTIAIILLVIAGLSMMLYIFTQQKASLPSWAPIVGEEFVHITGEFETAQAIAPGQGQAVVIAGIQVGKITAVELEEGHAKVGMDIEPEFMELIHPDAELLMRPKTNLNDMTVEVTPGTAKGHLEEGDNIPLSQTQSNTNLDAFLATLDADTRQYIQLLVAGGAEGIGGRGRQLGGALRRFQPFVHYLADINSAVAERRQALRRVIHNFGQVTEELARRDAEVERFVSGSQAGLRGFANQQSSLEETLVEFPATLAAVNAGLGSSSAFSLAARPSLIGLIPQAEALGPAIDATGKFFDQTTVPIRDQIRPFTRQVRPVLTHAAQGAPAFKKTVTGFGRSLEGLNSLFNTLAFKPKGKESYLFYLPWVNHNINASFNLSDAGGPIQRGLVMLSCNGAYLGYGASGTNPYIKTLLQSARLPHYRELPETAPEPNLPIACGPNVK